MKIEVINTGSEIILGYVLNSHLGYLSTQLSELGLRITRQTSVPDGPMICDVIEEASQRSDVVFVTGGLGPTSDDMTRDALVRHFNAPLEFHPNIMEKIQAYFKQRNMSAPEIVRVQAMVPSGAVIMPNNCGTAPGLYFERDHKHVFCLPGPPRELRPMFEDYVLPILRRLIAHQAPFLQKVFRIIGVGESSVQDRIEDTLRQFENMAIGYCARPGEVDLRIGTTSPEDLDKASAIILEAFKDAIYATGTRTMEQVVIERATQAGIRLATAESCTGGLVAHRITSVPGASHVYQRGWVTYSNPAKVDELGVNSTTLDKHGAVSSAVAMEMAMGALQRSGADLAVSVTGVAGPTGGSPEKPIGLVYFGLATKDKNIFVEKHLTPARDVFKQMASQVALDLIRRELIYN
jgi:nicotinamide-nucleotide amidase